MPIWSLTLERLERLKNQITAKKGEYDELDALSEKDLWCRDLDAFAEEWEIQLKLDDEIQTGIKRMGRRASQKIGAGRGRKAKAADDDYNPTKKAARQPKAVKPEVKTELKSQQRFLEKFQATAKPKAPTSKLGGDGAVDDFSDDDFALLGKKTAIKQEVKEESEPPASMSEVAGGRAKRAAVTKSKYVVDDDSEADSDDDFMELGKPSAAPKTSESASASASEAAAKPAKRTAAAKAKSLYVDDLESESDASNMLGDVGAMVKGIGGAASGSGNNGRLSLFAMSRPEAGDVALPKLKNKASKANLDFDSHDDTNYEALAMSSPRKSVKADEIDDFLSDDDVPAARATSQMAVSKGKAPLSVVPAPVKKRGRPAGSKNKAADDAPKAATKKATAKAPAKTAAAKPKAVHLSPAAKAYAAKQAKNRKIMSDDEEDDLMEEPSSPIVRPKARPGRAAASKAKPIVLDSDDNDLMDVDGKTEDSEDAFAMDESD
jgi:DNA topoisomerase II